MTPWSFESVCQPWLNSSSFVCHQWAYSCESPLWRVVKLKHSSEGRCHPHLGNINHRLWDGRPLVMWTVMCGCLTPAQFTQFLLLRVESIGVASSVSLEVGVIAISRQTSAEANGSSHLKDCVLCWVFGKIVVGDEMRLHHPLSA